MYVQVATQQRIYHERTCTQATYSGRLEFEKTCVPLVETPVTEIERAQTVPGMQLRQRNAKKKRCPSDIRRHYVEAHDTGPRT